MPTSKRLKCPKCQGHDILVSESQQMLSSSVYDSETGTHSRQKKLHADVRCQSCGYRWWSRQGVALAESRRKDETAKVQAQQEREG